jgi:hypothetical protein
MIDFIDVFPDPPAPIRRTYDIQQMVNNSIIVNVVENWSSKAISEQEKGAK